MKHLNLIRAALKSIGAAPVLAVPVPGHAPICIKAKLLKKALKGITIDSVEFRPNRWLKITGRAKGNVHTCSSFAPMDSRIAMEQIGEWSRKERLKRKKVAIRGVLSAKEQRALKLKAAEKAGIAELIQAQKDEKEILADARASVFPVITPYDVDERAHVIAEYSAFRKSLPNRKRGSIIRWKLAKLREQVKGMTVTKREYEERPAISPYARRRKTLKREYIELRRQKDKVLYAALLYQIGQLEKQYKTLYPPVFRQWNGTTGEGYYRDAWIAKRPNSLPYTVPSQWRNSHDEDERNENTVFSRLVGMANRLKDARANIRALTPPTDEQEELSQAA